MKKLLSLLGVTLFVTSSTLTVVSCDKNNKNIGHEGDLLPIQQEMLSGAEFISRLIIGGRHENLNYNVNEILSMYLTPQASAMQMPVAYKYNEQKIDLGTRISNFKNLLAPWTKSFDQDGYAGMFASYVMGMYDNNFYNTMINPQNDKAGYFADTFSKTGNTGYNNKTNNAMGYAAGLGKDIKLSQDEERRNLAWGIQDTGALSNYLLTNSFDGANPTDTNGTTSPSSAAEENNKGTNGSGYAWYNSVLHSGKANRSKDYKDKRIQDKLNSNVTIETNSNKETYQSKIQGKDFDQATGFNSIGALFASTAGSQNLGGKIALMSSLINNISSTKSGALNLADFANFMLPMIVDKEQTNSTFSAMQALSFSLITNIWKTFKTRSPKFSEQMQAKIQELDVAPEPVRWWFPLPPSGTEQTSVEYLFNKQPKDKINPGTNAKKIVEIIDLFTQEYQATPDKTDFYHKYFEYKKVGNTSPFGEVYGTLINFIDEASWNDIMKHDNGGINLLNFVKQIYEGVSKKEYQDQLLTVINYEGFKDKKYFRDLTPSEQTKFLEMLGYNKSGEFVTGSVLKGLYEGVKKDSTITGHKEFADFFDKFSNAVNSGMKLAHEKVISNLYDDANWIKSDIKVTSTSNEQTGGKMEFKLTYKGKGDHTSNANQQNQKIDVPQNFNPYQTIIDHQKDVIDNQSELSSKLDLNKISGKVLGVEQGKIKKADLIKYDGLGNFQDLKPVEHSYKIVWENISQDTTTPYWVITSIKNFDANGKEFFNIY